MTHSHSITYATRRSQLALAQSRAFIATLIEAHPELVPSELLVVTTGDKVQDRPLNELGGKGLFVKEIEEALLEGKAQLAVHSIKDVPALLADGLTLACVPKRADPRDVLVSRSGLTLERLPRASRVGTSSLRRAAYLKKIRPDLELVALRGNVDTRLRKVHEGVIDAAVLAAAGLERLGRLTEATEVLAPEVCLPAVGQGALGIECRIEDEKTLDYLRLVHDKDTAIAVAAERGVMLQVEGSCHLPVAAYGVKTQDGSLWLRAMLADADGSRMMQVEERLRWPESELEAARIGKELGRRLRA